MTRLSLRGLLALAALGLTAAFLAKDFTPTRLRARLTPASGVSGVDAEYARFLDSVAAATPPDATVCVLAASRPGTDAAAAYWLAPRRVVGSEGWAQAHYVAVYRRQNTPPLPHGEEGVQALPGGFLQKK